MATRWWSRTRTSVMLLTRIEYFPDFSESKVEALRQAVEGITPDYAALAGAAPQGASRRCSTASPWISAAASQYGMSTEELLADQRSRPDYSPALLEKIFEMGRHWFILNSGKYPSIARRGQRHHQSANGGRRAGRPARRHAGVLQLDGEPGPGLPGER